MNDIRRALTNFIISQKTRVKNAFGINKVNEITYADDIILIGPIGTGKSTIGKLLSEQLGMPQCSVDSVRWDYYRERGFDKEKERKIRETEGFEGVYKYWKPFEAYAVKRALETRKGYVFDFGGGHSVYEDERLFNQVKEVLKPYKNVILLLPCEDLKEAQEILSKRCQDDSTSKINKHFLTHHSNRDLAKFVVYTKGKTPIEVSYEIINIIKKEKNFSERSKSIETIRF